MGSHHLLQTWQLYDTLIKIFGMAENLIDLFLYSLYRRNKEVRVMLCFIKQSETLNKLLLIICLCPNLCPPRCFIYLGVNLITFACRLGSRNDARLLGLAYYSVVHVSSFRTVFLRCIRCKGYI